MALRFALKSAVAGGVVYFTIEQGVWKQSDETADLYRKLYRNVTPLLGNVKSEIPFEIPEPPKSEEVWFFLQNGWNKGVIATSMFIYKLPCNIVQWSKCGIQMLQKQLQQIESPPSAKSNQEQTN